MSRLTFPQIIQLAEATALPFFKDGRLDLDALIESEGISQSFGDYEDCYDGLLECVDNEFHIYLNKNNLRYSNSTKTRFTKAHELGHYKIPHHKSQLLAGKSLSFHGEGSDPNTHLIEREANHFASYLLMPRILFSPFVTLQGKGIEPIINASNQFATSIEATLIHYIKQNLFPCLAIKWKMDYSVANVYYTQKFKDYTKVFGLPPILINKAHLTEVCQTIKDHKLLYHDTASHLSNWIANTSHDLKTAVILEQTMRLGKYGGMTLITL